MEGEDHLEKLALVSMSEADKHNIEVFLGKHYRSSCDTNQDIFFT